jgi:hypothetical protein
MALCLMDPLLLLLLLDTSQTLRHGTAVDLFRAD